MLRSVCAALLAGTLLASTAGITALRAEADQSTFESVRFDFAPTYGNDEPAVRTAVAAFVKGMADADAMMVWKFASEEDQAAFGTEEAVLAAFADAFPALTRTERVVFLSFAEEGDTPFVEVALTAEDGATYTADIGLWLDDAGDWKVVSCDIKPATDRVA